MKDFSFWVVLREARQGLVDPSVLQAYEAEFKRALNRLIQRTQDPVLREKFTAMLDCPLLDSRNQCRPFADYVLSALVKNGIHQQFDIEASLAYVVEKMLMPTSETGGPRETVFGSFDEKRPYSPEGNPLQARFLSWLQYAVNNIKRGKIPRLSSVAKRPQGTVSITPGRTASDEPAAGVSSERIAARPSGDAELQELIGDISSLLQKKQEAFGINLVGLFGSIMGGDSADIQRRKWGDASARLGRQVIVTVIRQYAEKSQNYKLLRLLDLFKDFRANKASPARRALQKSAKPQLTPGKMKDFASILAVIDRFERPVGTANLGKYRRRWLEYPPRDASGGHRNRLEEVLAKMIEEGVLKATRTQKGAYVYEAGPNADKYRLSGAGLS